MEVERGRPVSRSLIAFDTDHIKSYVFGTNKLREIRGASSLLDSLNRVRTVMAATQEFGEESCIYANGGSALFLIEAEDADTQAEKLAKEVQSLYHSQTHGGHPSAMQSSVFQFITAQKKTS